jgi:hypothetical protein
LTIVRSVLDRLSTRRATRSLRAARRGSSVLVPPRGPARGVGSEVEDSRELGQPLGRGRAGGGALGGVLVDADEKLRGALLGDRPDRADDEEARHLRRPRTLREADQPRRHLRV